MEQTKDANIARKSPADNTNIGVIQDPVHSEPWIIAMDEKPGRAKVLYYGLHWDIEAMFSDIKSRGFYINQTPLKTAEWIERLLLALTIAMM
jgi:hypothetical protein